MFFNSFRHWWIDVLKLNFPCITYGFYKFPFVLNNLNALIKGKTPLIGNKVNATDLRGGASLLVAGLIASGVTIIDNIAYILRGYDEIMEKLTKVGAKIEII